MFGIRLGHVWGMFGHVWVSSDLDPFWDDLVPFREMTKHGLAGIMPAHVIYPKIDSQPAGFSTVWLQKILRSELEFDGCIFSDDLSMEGAVVAGNIVQRAEIALNAGCDMVLVCNDRQSALLVSDWLEFNNIPGSSKLNKLRANPAQEIADLYSEEKWLAACEMVCSLTKT